MSDTTAPNTIPILPKAFTAMSPQKIKLLLTVVFVLLVLVATVMCMQTAGYEKLSPLKVARVNKV